MPDHKITLTEEYLKGFVREFEKRYEKTVFQRQEKNLLHNTVEWGSWVYECLKTNDTKEMIRALQTLYDNYQPGILSSDVLRSSKNLAISLIAVMSNLAALDRIVDNELALTAADVCITMCEEMKNREDLNRCLYAGLVKLSDLMIEHREKEYHYIVRQAKDYVHKNLHGCIQVQDIAEALHVSPEHLSRSFHKAEGITLKEYLQEERLDRAKNLLRFSDYSISAISQYLAFSSQSHFSRVFRKATGKSPLEYRRDFSDGFLSSF